MAKKFKFRLMVGGFEQSGEDKLDAEGNVVLDPSGNPVKTTRAYKTGDIIHTDTDMSQFNGGPGMTPKFERLHNAEPRRVSSPAPVPHVPVAAVETTPEEEQTESDESDELPPSDTYDSMTVAELKAHAKAEEINIQGLSKKEDIIAAIRQSVSE